MGFAIYFGGMFALVVLGVLIFEVEEAPEFVFLALVTILWPIFLPLGMVIGAGYLVAQGLKKVWYFLKGVGEEEAAFEGRMEGRNDYPAPKP
jgi:hypothetical protein